mgnify:CR=1 FL=1
MQKALDIHMKRTKDEIPLPITGRCYCGATTILAAQLPQTIAYCHCEDFRRSTGGPVAAFAAFDPTGVTFTPNEGASAAVTPGVARTFCEACGSPISARFEYLPDQVYVPIGILDQADALPPRLHAHAGERLSWLHIEDDIERVDASSRYLLAGAATPEGQD